jgi:integrase
MSLFKRGDVWWYQFYHRGRRYRDSTGTSSKSLAADIHRKVRREVEASAFGIQPQRRATLVSVAADEWVAAKTPTWSTKTLSASSLDVRRIKHHLGRMLVTDVTADDVTEYIAKRKVEGAAEKTVRNEIGSLRSILKRHKVWAAVKDDGLRLPSIQTHDIGMALTTEQEEALLHACAASRSRSLVVAVTIALSTGMRHDEIRLLTWQQVDFGNLAVRVGRSKTEHGAGRWVPLNQRAVATLRRWADGFPERRPAHYIFPTEHVGFAGDAEVPQICSTDPTKPITSWKVAWTTAREKAGVHCRFHDLRHTVVTRLLERGQPLAVVADIMGWSPATASRMARRYSHIGNSARREAMAVLDHLAPEAGQAPISD